MKQYGIHLYYANGRLTWTFDKKEEMNELYEHLKTGMIKGHLMELEKTKTSSSYKKQVKTKYLIPAQKIDSIEKIEKTNMEGI